MKRLFPLLCCLFLTVGFVAHKYYVSVTDITYSEESGSIQIISRYFTDDLDRLISERYGVKAALMSENEHPSSNSFISRYLNDKLRIYLNGEQHSFVFLGKEYDTDLTKCYLEIQGVESDAIRSVRVESEVLYDLFEDQQNIIHLEFPGKKKSFLLHRENYKAMLNF